MLLLITYFINSKANENLTRKSIILKYSKSLDYSVHLDYSVALD